MTTFLNFVSLFEHLKKPIVDNLFFNDYGPKQKGTLSMRQWMFPNYDPNKEISMQFTGEAKATPSNIPSGKFQPPPPKKERKSTKAYVVLL